MTCQYARCRAPATVKTRFGDGYWWPYRRACLRQTFVHYCDLHFQQVDRLFYLHDVRLLAHAG